MAVIDAYEIGIQLLLQEDVSAGLTVINRGLADVDRAIAATSANLAGLVREAETATKAVAAAVSGRSTIVNTIQQKPDVPLDQPSESRPKQEPVLSGATELGEKAVAPNVSVAEPMMQAKPSVSQESSERSEPALEQQKSAVSSSAPARSAVDETVRSDPGTTPRRVQPETALQIAVSPAVPIAPPASEAQSERSRAMTSVGQQPRTSTTSQSTPVALTASVSREPRSATARRHVEQAQPSSISGLPARRERPVAPWSGVDQSDTQAEETRLHEKASAPQSAGRNQAESTGGRVMLDGRLVGQWLSEHMGREASRPPNGTSFFDPRQTPAWNVSGAL